MTKSSGQLDDYKIPPLVAIIIVNLMLLVAAIAEFAYVPSNVVVSVVYPAAVAACLWAGSLRFLWFTAVLAVMLASCVHRYAFQLPLMNMEQVTLINRLGAIFTTLIVALFVDRGIRTRTFAIGQVFSLEGLNLELGQREEEIVRQNEELQSQTEELERQTEELRVTNEELASWERRLEELLELSRSLTADTPRSEVFTKICESLSGLAETHATALLERDGDELKIRCHHGFGPDGLRSPSIPFPSSFSSRVMQLGQTGYVEDIRLLPDVRIPQPQDGPEFRAVLSTPLRIDGRTIGTIEAYAPGPRTWNAAEIAIIESLAIQASKSLQEAQLMEVIQHQRRRFETAFRTVPIGMVIAEDPKAQKIRMNGAAAAMFELPSDENISLSTPAGTRLAQRVVAMNNLGSPEYIPLWRALRGEEIYGADLELRTHQGQRLALQVSAIPILDDEQRVSGAIAAVINITEHRALERELDLRRREAEEASIRKTRFLAAISHDIRTPANAVNIMADIIRRLSTDPARSAEIIDLAERLQANVHVLIDLIGDVLDIARFDTGKMELSMSDFALSDLIEQEVNQVIPLAKDKRLELIVDEPERPIWVRSDRVKLARVLGNLLGNAIKFTEKGSIRIGARISNDQHRRLVIQVKDTGIGISPDHLDWIFDEFAQVQNPARDRSKGSGLGLAICKRIVELLDGTISIRSELSVGSTFTVELPSSAIVMRTEVISAVPKKPVVASPDEPLDLKILLIEDHSATRDGTSRLLREEGAKVIEAADGKTGLSIAGNDEFDVILLDMMLPDLDGREILRTFQTVRPKRLRGILVLSGDLTNERMDEIKSLGADGFIGKPIELPKLLHTLRSFKNSR